VEWSPSFECHVRPDGEHEYRIGHQLIDEFLEFVVGRARPNTVRAYAHDLSVFFSVVKKDPIEVRPKDVMSFVTAGATGFKKNLVDGGIFIFGSARLGDP
jgi:hypothetical protein